MSTSVADMLGLAKDAMSSPSALCKAERIELEGIDPDVFFEFMRFVYTDKCKITLDNVTEFLGLSDEFLVPGLTHRCIDFLTGAIVPEDALKVLSIIEKILCKIVVWFWRLETTEANDQDSDDDAGGSSAPSPLSQYVGNTGSESARLSMCSVGGQRGSLSSVYHIPKIMQMEVTRALKNRAMAFYLARAVREIEDVCWECICMNTAEVLASQHFFDCSYRHVRMILEMGHLTVPEISIFRAVRSWLSKNVPEETQSVKQGIFKHTSHKTDIRDTLLSLVRFPTMTVEQIQWEVVPSQLLAYRDVQALLQYKQSTITNPLEQQSLVRFISEPREGFEEEDLPPQEDGAAMQTLRTSLPEYKAKEGDIIDQQLAAQLREARLRHATDQHVKALSPVHSVSPDCGFPMRDHGRIKEPVPQDFEYIKPGSYLYQQDRHIRMWLQDGEVMVRDASRPPTGYDISKVRKPGSRARGEDGPRSARLANAGKNLTLPGESLKCYI
jgi:hypothetical protein